MITLRNADDRGHANHGWLDTRHSFSFADYYDPAHMGFRALRVINEDVIAPNTGFPTHPHQDMEIVTYVLDGAVEHADSMGNGGVIRAGQIQRMTAGTGIRHSERNPSDLERTHLLQIWIEPAVRGLEPSWEEVTLRPATAGGAWQAVALPEGGNGAARIHQDVRVYAARLAAGAETDYALAPRRHAWLQVARGSVGVNGTSMTAGDGAAVSDEPHLHVSADTAAEVLLFDLA